MLEALILVALQMIVAAYVAWHFKRAVRSLGAELVDRLDRMAADDSAC